MWWGKAVEKIRAPTHLRSHHHRSPQHRHHHHHHHHNHHHRRRRQQLKHHQRAAMAMRTLGIGRAGRAGFAQDVLRVRACGFYPSLVFDIGSDGTAGIHGQVNGH